MMAVGIAMVYTVYLYNRKYHGVYQDIVVMFSLDLLQTRENKVPEKPHLIHLIYHIQNMAIPYPNI